MNTRRLLFWLVLIGALFLLRPRATWRETRRIWSQRNLILGVLVTVIAIYLFYGIYSLYRQGGLPGW
jgi:hypothetical protein